jgi:glutamine cyclotransferase
MRHTATVRVVPAALASLLAAGSTLVPAAGSTLEPSSLETPGASPHEVPVLDWAVVSRRPHDAGAWTQGLQLDEDGRLYESTGRLGRSSLREVDPQDGTVLRFVALPDDQFAEGLASVDGRLIQLTWKDGLARSWDAATFDLLATYPYQGEGWGLCFDGQRLVMSDGSDRLTFRDPTTFERLGTVALIHDLPGLQLNELECVDGEVWANAYQTDTIVRIDPTSGRLTGLLDLSLLRQLGGVDAEGWDVLNGIAFDASTETLLVTGKLWSEVFEIRLLEETG